MSAVWRLIVDGRVDGALAMALDRAAQLARERGAVPPTVRLYRFARPTVTLGRFQPPHAVDRAIARASGVEVVRRFTGGRGVLHDDEVTYTLVASVEDGVPRGVHASYRWVLCALERAYALLGIDASVGERAVSRPRTAACYLSATRADLICGGRKLSGSAQTWTGSTLMQHGSFVRSRDVALEAALFGLNDEQRRGLEEGTATIAELSGRHPSDEELIARIIEAFEDALGIRLIEGGWTAIEAELARTLLPRVRIDGHAPVSTSGTGRA